VLSGSELNLRIKLKKHAYHLAIIQKMKWRQRFVALWLKQGDANSKYFHNLASARRTQNHIPHITVQPTNTASPPVIISHAPHILSEFTTFYRNLLGTPILSLLKPHLDTLYGQPNLDFLRALVDPISSYEIKNDVFALPKDKITGPDGFPIEFFQTCWHIVSEDLHHVVTSFYYNQLDL
jgi:hypothetical protein